MIAAAPAPDVSTDPQAGQYLTLAEAAVALGVSVRSLGRWSSLGQLRTVKLPGRQVRIPRSEIDRLLAVKDGPAEEPELALAR